MTGIRDNIINNPYNGYAYSYPHKTAYRPFESPIALKEVWHKEKKDSLFLYVHIPFCEMRCGFCNLFTMANPQQDKVTQYLQALERQAHIVKDALGNVTFTQIAVGGGTPSFLHESELEKLFSIIENVMEAAPAEVPTSFEVSPKTVSAAKLKYLFQKGVDRISIGIQSFFEGENKLLGRPQRNNEVYRALELIKECKFSTLNVDLIYGGAGQNQESWIKTLTKTLEFFPEEIYLYPLYVRPLTGLEKMGMSWDNFRLQLYRQGREYLLTNGYEQVSMRMFRKKDLARQKHSSITYCCQEDGMVGLGSGARSYTETIHYSTEYAVGRKGVIDIIDNYIHQTDEDFSFARFGIHLPDDERKRRYCIKSLLHGQGLNREQYFQWFHSDVFADFPELNELIDAQMVFVSPSGVITLTDLGMELADSIGPWMYSKTINALMKTCELR